MSEDFAALLAESHAAVKLAKSKLGMSKAMDKAQTERIADLFAADKKMVGGKSKLFGANAAWKAINKVMNDATAYWKENTLPFPEDGVRLLRHNKLGNLTTQMMRFQAALDQAVAAVNDVYPQLLREARERRGALYDPSQYPTALSTEFSINWNVVNLSPPGWLRESVPVLFRREEERTLNRFRRAVVLSEEAFQAEFGKVIRHLADQLQGVLDGEPKCLHPSQLHNVVSFIERFRDLSIRSDEELDTLVQQAENVVVGVSFDVLEDNPSIQQVVACAMQAISERLDNHVHLQPTWTARWDD